MLTCYIKVLLPDLHKSCLSLRPGAAWLRCAACLSEAVMCSLINARRGNHETSMANVRIVKQLLLVNACCYVPHLTEFAPRHLSMTISNPAVQNPTKLAATSKLYVQHTGFTNAALKFASRVGQSQY